MAEATRPTCRTEIDTPALLVDLDRLEANLDRMASFMREHNTALRPHMKTHKCPHIARMQIERGAAGICCAKVGEAEAMVEGGISDILVANQVVGPIKLRRLMTLAHRAKIAVAADNPANVAELDRWATQEGSSLGVLVEVDIGNARAGTRSVEETLAVAQAVAAGRSLRLAGIMGFEGHLVLDPREPQRREGAAKAYQTLVTHAEAVRAAGMPVEVISCGGTGTYRLAAAHPAMTEVQAGSYATMDGIYCNVIPEFAKALTVLMTVCSKPARDRAILDGGLKAVTPEFGVPTLRDIEGARVLSLSEEHATVELNHPTRDLQLGDLVELYPAHGCTTINLHERLHVMRGETVVDIWPVTARGRTQ